MTSPTSPPRARLAFRVGVVGHRPDRLPTDKAGLEALRDRISTVLAAARSAAETFQAQSPDAGLYSAEPPLMRAISPLADGSDRMFAEEAMRQGYALCCPMPFHQEEYEKDLTPPSRAHFRALLEQARQGAGLTTFELDGERSEDGSGAAYGAAGRVVLNQSDLLLVVWDGMEAKGAGGTVETAALAVRFHVPVLWIDAVAPFGWGLLTEPADLEGLKHGHRRQPAWSAAADPDEERWRIAEAVTHIVQEEIGLEGEGSDEARRYARDYFAERRPRLNLPFVWKMFRDAVGSSRIRAPQLLTRDYVEAVAPEWPTNAGEDAARSPDRMESDAPRVGYWVNAHLRDHFAWSDKPADIYADAHRSAFVLSYLLAAGAVLVALIPMAMGWSGPQSVQATPLAVTELLMLVTVLALLARGRSRRWHERWMEYRLLAELTRQLKFLIPFGGGRPLPRTPTHLAVYGDPARAWMYWRLRAIAREVGLPDARVTEAYVLDCVEDLAEIADGPRGGQRGFHRLNWQRLEHIHHRLHKVALALFALTLVGIVAHLTGLMSGEEMGPVGRFLEHNNGWLILGAAFLPALGAALTGINYHGEFLRMAKRSRAMEDGFQKFAASIAALKERIERGEPAPLADAALIAGRMAEAMVDEVIDWRTVVLDRPQSA